MGNTGRSTSNIPYQYTNGTETKRCSICKERLLLSSFTKNSQAKDGLRSQCKSCMYNRRKSKPDYKYNKDLHAKKYRDKSKDKIAQHKKQYYQQNKSKILARLYEYYQENKDKIKLANKQRALKNSLRKKETQRLWREANRNEKREKGRIYGQLDKVKTKNRARNRLRKLKMKGGDKFTTEIRDELLIKQTYLCAICGEPLVKGDDGNYIYHLDHIIPLIKGGPHVLSNRQILHPHCNCSKGAR